MGIGLFKNYSNLVILIGHSFYHLQKDVSDDFYWGANVKFIRRDIAEFGATGIGFDIGAIYMPYDNFTLGANLMDLTTTLLAVGYHGRNELISPTAKIGASYNLEILGGKIYSSS